MLRASARTVLTGVVVLAALAAGLAGQAPPGNPVSAGTSRGEWPTYTGDLRGSRYSPLDQIDAANFGTLEIAWRFRTDNLGPVPEFKLEGTPLVVNGRLFATAGTRRAVVALDARTGELLWMHRYPEGTRAAAAPRQLSGRGLAYWTDGRGDERVIYVTIGYRLVALDAKTGVPLPGFGEDGIVDLKAGVFYGDGTPIALDEGDIGLHAAPTVTGDLVIVGAAMREGAAVATHNNTKGLVRAFDVRTGRKVWQFTTIPGPGEFGHDTWLDGSWATNGNAGVWSQITVDEELGLAYLPVESPTSDYYGGHRPGNNLFGESLVAVDLKTGERRWHFQFVHHPIWDHDISSAPLLIDIVVDGRPIKAVAVPTKQSYLYVFDRVTGEPVWPIPETPVPAGDVPGEWYSPTQPIPSKPAPYARAFVRVPDDLIDFTPALRAEALEVMRRYKHAPTPFVPYILGDAKGTIGSINIGNVNGGTNWPGGGFDPETRIVYAPAGNAALSTGSLVEAPEGYETDVRYILGVRGREVRGYKTQPSAHPDGPAFVPLSVQGLPILKPPYGVLTAIHLDRGEILWQVAHGETPDNVRTHKALEGLTIPRTGQPGMVGPLVTKTLVILGDPLATTRADGARGAMLRAYDKATGAEVGAVWMPAQQSGSPMTYALDGRQYLVVAVSGSHHAGEYLAFALPEKKATSEGGGAPDRVQ